MSTVGHVHPGRGLAPGAVTVEEVGLLTGLPPAPLHPFAARPPGRYGTVDDADSTGDKSGSGQGRHEGQAVGQIRIVSGRSVGEGTDLATPGGH